ncbi:MFS transporter [Streptacidiphilus fuscans]|uniref:MFS transporter n=1 Tax=Streptacidiphilus fuscans TaxID=2789292 RepID=A0A931BAC8_9ACTN|nr:MFS transporter [Streptacidiphilus fuscans]MBF9070643.1 MFS transporter [Streptacidiphilus fuscans]
MTVVVDKDKDESVDPVTRAAARRDFRFMWAGQSISLWGDQFMVLALPLLAVNVLHTSVAEALLLPSAMFFPFLVLGLPAGAIVERLRRRTTMLVASAAQAVAIGVIWLLAVTHVLVFPVLFGLLLISGSGVVFFQVAYTSYLPSLFTDPDDLHKGNARLSLSESTSLAGGRAVGGMVVRMLGVLGALAANALSFLASVLALAVMRHKEPARAVTKRERGWIRRDVTAGLKFLIKHPQLQPMVLCGTFYLLFLSMVDASLVLYCNRVLGLNQLWTGVVMGAAAVGYPIGNMLSPRIAKKFGTARALAGSITLSVVGMVVSLALSTPGGMTGAIGLIAGSIVHGIGEGSYIPTSLTLRHRVTPPELLSRVGAVQRFSMWGSMSLGSLLASGVTALVGLRGAVWTGALAALILVPLALLQRGILAEVRTGVPPKLETA